MKRNNIGTRDVTGDPLLLSIVTPAYNEQDNLELLYQRLRMVLDGLGLGWEWVIVDDHSNDGTFSKVSDIAEIDDRVRGIRLARNSGSHLALACGLHAARGDCAVALASDLQDPPEVIPKLLDKWREGARVVWAVRAERKGESRARIGMARLYYWVMRNVAELRELPETGADCFLADRKVLNAFSKFRESNVSILALIAWIGYRQAQITYTKEARTHGQSGWTFKKKLKLLVDSVASFSYAPIRLMAYLGFIIATFGFLYACVVIINAFLGDPPPGWTMLTVLVLVIGGIQMLMMGVLGEYLWRALDESRRRPRYLVDETTDD